MDAPTELETALVYTLGSTYTGNDSEIDGEIGATGSLSLKEANLVLNAQGVTPNDFGLFLVGTQRAGALQLPLANFPALWTVAMSRLRFQFWYRDGLGGWKLTDALEIGFLR